MSSEFSVYWYDRDGGQHRELQFVEAEAALRAVKRLTQGPASIFGYVERVIITDGGDCCCFEWFKNKGQTFPKEKF